MTAGIQGAATSCPGLGPGAVATQCGIALEADVGSLLSSEPMFARLSGQVGDALGRRIPLSLRLSGLSASDGELAFRAFCARLAAALDSPGAHTRVLEISVPAGKVPPDTALAVRRDLLGPGRLNVLCDTPCLVDDGFWLRLWRLRRDANLTVALWPIVRGPSALLPAEQADSMEPAMGLQVPAESAWVSGVLSLPQHMQSNGRLDEEGLVQALRQLVYDLDERHGTARWPTPAMRQDAWLNRRLAIVIEGVGDLALRLGCDPANAATMPRLSRLLDRLRCELRRTTQALAVSRDALPAIELSNPVRGLAQGPARDNWEKRWQRAVARGAVSHRNLLALSPWALFPRHNADLSYCRLLPLLSRADVCLFRPRPSIAHWKCNEFKHFYQNIWAIRRQIEAQALVAERL